MFNGRIHRQIVPIGLAFFFSAADPAKPLDDVFVLRPPQIWKLEDRNGDGDFLDVAEMRLYAEGLPIGARNLAVQGDRLYVTSGAQAIQIVQDLNGDGDAFDFAEVSAYSTGAADSLAAGAIRARPDGALFVVDMVQPRLYLVRDLNHDGDANDAGERHFVWSSLPAATGLGLRPDDRLLIATAESLAPVMILNDLSRDEDYDDYAEALSFVENIQPGRGLAVVSSNLAYLSQPLEGRILALRDQNLDGDALDFGEVGIYAQGLSNPTSIDAGDSGAYVLSGLQSDSVRLLADLNGDGDALDFGEAVTVAAGLPNMVDLAVAGRIALDCLPGDANADGQINTADLPGFVDAVIGMQSLEPCRVDVNGDGVVNGADVSAFVARMLQ